MRISDWSSDVCSSDLSIAHLGAHYQRRWYRYDEDGVCMSPGLPDRLRTVRETETTWNYELCGDYQFGAGPRKLKLICLRSLRHEPVSPEGGIGRGHVCNPVTNAHLLCRLLLAHTQSRATTS